MIKPPENVSPYSTVPEKWITIQTEEFASARAEGLATLNKHALDTIDRYKGMTLFGSFARGDSTLSSDIDICVFLEQPPDKDLSAYINPAESYDSESEYLNLKLLHRKRLYEFIVDKNQYLALKDNLQEQFDTSVPVEFRTPLQIFEIDISEKIIRFCIQKLVRNIRIQQYEEKSLTISSEESMRALLDEMVTENLLDLNTEGGYVWEKIEFGNFTMPTVTMFLAEIGTELQQYRNIFFDELDKYPAELANAIWEHVRINLEEIEAKRDKAIRRLKGSPITEQYNIYPKTLKEAHKIYRT